MGQHDPFETSRIVAGDRSDPFNCSPGVTNVAHAEK